MSDDLAFSLGERRGDPSTSAKTRGASGKSMNFALPAPDPALTVALAPVVLAAVRVLIRRAGADRIVAEIGPWIMKDRRRRAGL